MSSIFSNQINRADLRPYAQNPLYQIPIREKCVYCVHTGRLQILRTGWILMMHYKTHHSRERFLEEVMKVMKAVSEDLKL